MMETNRTAHIPIGIDVYGSGGQKIGRVIAVTAAGLTVEKGTFFASDHFIPNDVIAAVEPDRVILSISRQQALEADGADSAATDEVAAGPAGYDASGTATYTAEQAELQRQTGSAGVQAHMGESSDTPGLAGDLREGPSDHSDAT